MNALIPFEIRNGESILLSSEDRARKNLILHLLLIGLLVLTFVASLYSLEERIINGVSSSAFHFDTTFLIFLYFVLLFVLQKRRHVQLASFLLVSFCFSLTVYTSIRWGINLPANLLSYTLIITITSILLGNKYGFGMTGLIFLTLIIVGYRESYLHILHEWNYQVVDMRDMIFYSFILFVIMLVSWLSNRETERSLLRARISEKALQTERNLLEVKVAERTEELKQSQAERVSQLYHFAEFGRLSSGLFHDLVNPLFSLSLNIKDLENSLHPDLPEIKENIDRSLAASTKMERFISAVRKQIKVENFKEYFCLNSVIDDTILLLNYKAKKAGVEIKTNYSKKISTYQNPLEFQQVATNLVSNAIDSYENLPMTIKTIHLSLTLVDNIVLFEVIDKGRGIPENIRLKIFDPFFSTKEHYKGIGLGLSTTKRIIEKNFNGKVEVDSSEEQGSRFIVSFPHTTN